MSTIEELKKEALNELKQETSEVPTSLSGEIIAEIITFDNLQAKLSSSNKANIQEQASKLLSEGKFDEVQSLLNSAKSQTLQLANNLPRYILLKEGDVNYLVEAPKIAIKQTKSGGGIGTTDKNKYPHPFNIGDFIYLINKEQTIKSQVYQVTQAGLIGQDDHEVIKASIAVQNFMVSQIGKVLPDNFKGFPGTTFSMWRKVQQ